MILNVAPLFAYPLIITQLEENLDSYFKTLKNVEYDIITENGETEIHGNNWYISKNFYILDIPELLNLKTRILSIFDNIKNQVLSYEDTNFKISTSWMTKVKNNSSSHFHNHQNSFFSGVLYFEDYGDLKSFIEFKSFNRLSQISPCPPIENNFFNSSSWKVETKKNKLIFFPSELQHRVLVGNSEKEERYSLAFNIVPCGKIGQKDSTIFFDEDNLDY
jgi:hypothetical protein